MKTQEKILKTVSKQDKFNAWMYSVIKPYVIGDILETGSGLGVFSEKITTDFNGKILLSDINSGYIEELKRNFSQKENIDVKKLDLKDDNDFKNIQQKFNTIICLNVLEHIKDDTQALKNTRSLLKPNGKLILLVPCHKFLYNNLDRGAGHFRRYNKKELIFKTERAGFKIEKIFYFNFIAMAGWFINGTLFRKKTLNRGAFKLFNFFVPIIKPLEKYFLRHTSGMSLIVVLE